MLSGFRLSGFRLSGSRRWRRAGLAGLVAASTLTVLGGAPAARADSVRSAEAWVLNDINVRPAWRLTEGTASWSR